MNMKKVFMKEIDDRGIIWEYVIILDKKMNCFRVFEGNKINKDSEYLLSSTVNNDKCFGSYKFEDGEFILA